MTHALKRRSELEEFLQGLSTKAQITAKYEFGKKLGEGNFALVRECANKETSQRWAVKIIEFQGQNEQLELLCKELTVFKKVNHPNVLYMHEMYYTQAPHRVYIIMELVSGGNLFNRIVTRGKYSERDAADIFKQILLGLEYLHANGICHRDLKPENLLYPAPDSDVIKICDFGLSNIVSPDDLLHTKCGTPHYVAPEVLFATAGYSYPVDVWGAGVILYIMLSGHMPFFDEHNVERIYQQIRTASFSFETNQVKAIFDDVSFSAKSFIRRLLTLDAAQRPTATQALQDPWLASGGASDLHLQKSMDSIKSFNARRKLKMGIGAILAIERMKKALADVDVEMADDQ